MSENTQETKAQLIDKALQAVLQELTKNFADASIAIVVAIPSTETGPDNSTVLCASNIGELSVCLLADYLAANLSSNVRRRVNEENDALEKAAKLSDTQTGKQSN